MKMKTWEYTMDPGDRGFKDLVRIISYHGDLVTKGSAGYIETYREYEIMGDAYHIIFRNKKVIKLNKYTLKEE